MSKEVICKRHEKAIKKLAEIRGQIRYNLKYDSENAEVLADLLDTIDSDLYDIISEIEEARESGQKMEDRLAEYKESIENLGFVRNKY